MKFLIIVILFSSFLLQAETLGPLDLHLLVEQIAQGTHTASINYCAPEKPYFESDQDKEGFKKIVCPVPWDERSFYRNIHAKYCKERFGSSGYTCVEDDPAKMKDRLTNVELLEKTSKLARLKFDQYKKTFGPECCGEKKACLDRFAAVKLRLDPGDKPDAQYESDSDPSKDAARNTVMINYAKLTSAYNSENVERVLMVELAHACQFALISENKNDFKIFTGHQSRCDKESGLLLFKEGLGSEVSKCVMDEIESQIAEIPESEKKNYCFGKWYREAFSDMKFRSHFTSPYHWTYDMGRRSNQRNYASVFKYIKCGFPPDWKEKMCL